MTVLLVDAANVVGSRPDGWWRDRAGATERLLGRLAGADLRAPDGSRITGVVAVVEGRARDVAAPEGVRVVRAGGVGTTPSSPGRTGSRTPAPRSWS